MVHGEFTMRTIFLLGIAAGTLLLAEKGHSATIDHDRMGDAAAVALILPQSGLVTQGHKSHAPLDYGADYRGDDRVYTGSPDRAPAESDYRRTTTDADYQGRWTGTWNGTYEAPDGREYHGTYDGTYEGGAGADYPAPSYRDHEGDGAAAYHDQEARYREDAEMARMCRRDNGVGGAVIGGAVGGFAGNRIAGRGDRTAGTLIGAGVGAVAGAAIDQGEDSKRCKAWMSHQQSGGYYSQGGYYQGGSGYYQGGTPPAYGGGYGYYSPGVVVTTIIMPQQQYVTETIETTTVTYENVAVKKRHAPKKRTYRAKPKPRCTCR
ncbi:MAG: hypothetical protein RLZZ58_1138 [Pseudomonadota bacterium]